VEGYMIRGQTFGVRVWVFRVWGQGLRVKS